MSIFRYRTLSLIIEQDLDTILHIERYGIHFDVIVCA